MPNPAITQSADYLNQFSGSDTEAGKKPTPDELMQKLYSKRVPEPTFDHDKADRLQKIANINQAGRGLSVLGGILAYGLGAPVRRNAPDTTAPSIYSNYQANLDKYKSEKDANILRNYAKDVEDIKYGMSNAYRDQANELAKQRQADWMKAKEADNKLSWAKWSAEWDRNNKRDTEAARHNKVEEGISAQRNAIAQQKEDKKINKPEKPFMEVGVNNQRIPLSQGEFRQYLAEATAAAQKKGTNSPEWTDFQATMNAFKDNPLEGQKNIVQRYYTWKKEQEALNERRQQQAPAASGQTQTRTLPGLAPKNTGFKLPGLGK